MWTFGSHAASTDPVRGFTRSASMRLLWILCCLTIVGSTPLRESTSPTLLMANDDINYFADDPDVCRTVHCYEIAKRIIDSHDSSVDPCENFYDFACGSWSDYNPIPNTELEWSEDDIVVEMTYARIRDELEKEDDPSDIPPVKMVRQLYRSCMDLDAIERAGILPLLDIIQKTGGWPMTMPLNAWSPGRVRWQDVDKYYLTLFGTSAFLNVEYEHDENDTSRNILSMDTDVSHPMRGKKAEEALPFDFNDVYMNTILRVATMFAAEQNYTVNKRQLGQDVIDVVSFELDLVQILTDAKKTRQFLKEHTTFTIKQLQDWYDNFTNNTRTAEINFLQMIRFLFYKGGVEINATEPIVVYNEICLKKLAELLAKTKERVIINYIQWNMVHTLAFYTNEAMRKIKCDMYYSAYNISQPPRWKACVSLTELKDAASYLFVKKHIADDVLDKVSKMMTNIREEMKARVNRAEWIDADMKTYMIEKLQNMVKQIGYPKWYNNSTALIKEYEGLTIGSNFFRNILNCLKHQVVKNVKNFRVKTDRRREWLDFPMTVNAFYSESTNAIIIPAAEMQTPYFTESLPDSINYGAVGFVVGHEISHSFDSDGILHDKIGNKVSTIPKAVLDAYGDRAMCFVNQYNNYTIHHNELDNPLQIDGLTTKDENIADSTGIQAAFAAYKKARGKKQKIMKLPGLENVADDRLFFLSFATAWCQSARSDYFTSHIDDDHSPAMYRIIGSLANMEEFSETFGCPRDSSMNRKQKCSLWH